MLIVRRHLTESAQARIASLASKHTKSYSFTLRTPFFILGLAVTPRYSPLTAGCFPALYKLADLLREPDKLAKLTDLNYCKPLFQVIEFSGGCAMLLNFKYSDIDAAAANELVQRNKELEITLAKALASKSFREIRNLGGLRALYTNYNELCVNQNVYSSFAATVFVTCPPRSLLNSEVQSKRLYLFLPVDISDLYTHSAR